jgi:hypothetical protein
MAGAFIVNKQVVLSRSGLAYRVIAESMKDAIGSVGNEGIREMFALAEGLDILDMSDLNGEDFAYVVKVCEQEFVSYKAIRTEELSNDPIRNMIVDCWEGLLSALRRDPRMPPPDRPVA